MRTRLSHIVLGLCFAMASVALWSQPIGQVERLVEAFATNDAFARAIAFSDFEESVPPMTRPNTLASVWSAAANRRDRDLIRRTVLSYVGRKTEAELPWTSRLREIVHSGLRSTNRELRESALRSMTKRRGSPQMRSEVIYALQDEDESIRNLAITEIARWPNYLEVLTAYVQRNKQDKAHAATVTRAQFFVDRGGLR